MTTKDATLTTQRPSSAAQRVLRMGASEIAWADLSVSCPGMDLLRLYDGAMPTNVTKSKANRVLSGSVIPWVSFTSATPANMKPFFESCKQTGKEIWVTLVHEVNNGPKMSPDAFKALYVQLTDARNKAQAFNVQLAIILTAQPFRDGSYKQWFGTPGTWQITAGDAYRFLRPAGSPPDPKSGGLGKDRTMAYLLGEMPAFAKATNTKWAIGEFSGHPDKSKKTGPGSMPQWLSDTVAFCRADPNCAGLSIFHSWNGESGPWWIGSFHNFGTDAQRQDRSDKDPDTLNAWKNLVRTK